MKKLPIAAYVWSDLYLAGTTEDGHEYHAELFFVVIQFNDGSRIRHNGNFYGCKVGKCEIEGTPTFEDKREEAMAKANNLSKQVTETLANGGELNMNHWSDWHAEYGSMAYSEADTVLWEKSLNQ